MLMCFFQLRTWENQPCLVQRHWFERRMTTGNSTVAATQTGRSYISKSMIDIEIPTANLSFRLSHFFSYCSVGNGRRNQKYLYRWNYGHSIEIPTSNMATASSKKVSEGDCDSDRNGDMASDCSETWNTDSVEIPTSNLVFLTMKSSVKCHCVNKWSRVATTTDKRKYSVRLHDERQSNCNSIFECRSLSQLFEHTFVELAVSKRQICR